MNNEEQSQAEFYKTLLQKYHNDLVLMLRGRKPQTYISVGTAVSINIILKDVQNLLAESVGVRYLNILDTETPDFSTSAVILTITPYLVTLEKWTDCPI